MFVFSSRTTVETGRPIETAIARQDCLAAKPWAIASRSRIDSAARRPAQPDVAGASRHPDRPTASPSETTRPPQRSRHPHEHPHEQHARNDAPQHSGNPVSYTHLRAHETDS